MLGSFCFSLIWLVFLMQLWPHFAQASGEASIPRSVDGLSVLAWFAAVNALVIATAAVMRRRKAFASRRADRRKPSETDVGFTISNDVTETSFLFDRVREFGEDHGLPIQTVFDLCLIMDEMLSYVISNGFEEGQRASIGVHLGIQKGLARFKVEYLGRPLNPLDSPKIDLTLPIEDLPLDGWDIHMLRMLVDDINCESSEGKNIITAVKRWEAEADKDNGL